jgi:flagellin-like hook-associated protein FlgL
MYDTSMRYLQKNAGKLNKQYEQITSQQMINRPSDNPIGFTNAMNYRNILNSLGQKQINMNDGEVYMGILESAHESMNTLFGRSRDLGVQASNDTVKREDRLFVNMEVREMLELLVSTSQTKHKDCYVFSGKWTNQPPYEIKNGNADYRNSEPTNPAPNPAPNPTDPSDPIFDPNEKVTISLYDSAYVDPNLKPYPDNPRAQCIIPGSITGLQGLKEKVNPNDLDADYEVDYVNGTITLLSDDAKLAFFDYNPTSFDYELKPAAQRPEMQFDYVYQNSIDMSGEIYREVETGIIMQVNVSPYALFGKGGENGTNAFKEMITLMQGLWCNDQPKINEGIDTIDTARKRNLEQQAVEAARLNRLATTLNRNDELTLTNTAADSQIEGVELADALSQFALSQAVYDASLQAAAKLMQRTLMDYL